MCHFAQRYTSVEGIDLACLPKTLLVFTEQGMLFVVWFPLRLEEIFLTPVYHLVFVFLVEFDLEIHFTWFLKRDKTKI